MNKKIPTSSVSQVENFRSCRRKWFFSSVEYLPQEPKRSTAIGDCFHAVAERYLDVDENGLKNGKPPELYPEGWHIQKDFFGKKVLFVLDSTEQKIIKDLINKAIDEGKLIRRPGAVVEYNEKILLTEDISFQVRIDYAYDWTIEDHKTCKNFRYTLVDDPSHERYLGKDLQLKVYAYFWALKRHRETGETIPEYLTIRHNQFCVGPETPRIETPSTKVTFAECEKAFEELKLDVMEQLKLRQSFARQEIKWTDVEKDLDACGSYGGCPYKQVCVAQETHAMYKKRMNLHIEELTKSLEKEEKTMGFNLSSGATSEQAKVIEAMNAPAKTEAPAKPAPQIETVEELIQQRDELKAQLEGLGVDPFTTSKFTTLESRIEAAQEYLAKEAEKAKAKAEQEAKAKAEQEAKAKAEQEAKAKAEQEAKAKAEQEAKAKAKAPKPEVQEAPTESEAMDDPEKYKIKVPVASRSKDTFVYINCAPIGNLKSMTIQEIFAFKSAELAKVRDVDSYYDLPAFERRDSLKRAVPYFFNELEGLHIVAFGCDPDEAALLNAIMAQNVRVVASR